MTKKLFIAVLVVFSVLTPVFAGFDFHVTSEAGLELYNGTGSFQFLGTSQTTGSVAYDEGDLHAEVSAKVYFGNSEDSQGVSLETAFAQYKLNDFGNNTLTLTAGLALVDWEFGELESNGASLCVASETEYLVAGRQTLDNGFTVEAGVVLPLFGKADTAKIGVMGEKAFDTEVFKSVNAAVTYDFDKTLDVSASTKLNAWADITGGVDFEYNAEDKSTLFYLAAEASKDFEIKTDSSAMKLTETLSLTERFADGAHDLFTFNNLVELEVNKDVDAYLETEFHFDGYARVKLGSNVSVTDYFKVSPFVQYTYNSDSSFTLGGTVKFTY